MELSRPSFWKNKNILSFLLLPFSYVYLFAGFVRGLLVNEFKASAKVICIGNPTVGGSGKTPIVIEIAKLLEKNNKKFCIVTYGPGGSLEGPQMIGPDMAPTFAGDEALMLLEVGNVIISKDKARGVRLADSYSFDYILVDDGLQNPGFYKDISIASINNNNGIGNGFIFPSGPLRSPLKHFFKNIDLVIMEGDNSQISNFIVNHNKINMVRKFKKLDNSDYVAFSSIANNNLFFKELENSGANILKRHSFPDHHIYSNTDLDSIFEKSFPIDTKFITTKKDYVKLPATYKKRTEVFELELELDNYALLDKIIL